jgi:hypothetical protein
MPQKIFHFILPKVRVHFGSHKNILVIFDNLFNCVGGIMGTVLASMQLA